MAATDPKTEERLKAALWKSIGEVVDNTLLDSGNNATSQFIAALMELVSAQISNTAKDLESFAKHAGRAQISSDDVLLLARRNEGLETLLKGYVDELRRENGVSTVGRGVKVKGKKR